VVLTGSGPEREGWSCYFALVVGAQLTLEQEVASEDWAWGKAWGQAGQTGPNTAKNRQTGRIYTIEKTGASTKIYGSETKVGRSSRLGRINNIATKMERFLGSLV